MSRQRTDDGGQPEPVTIPPELVKLAVRQQHAVTLEQCRASGLTEARVRTLVRRGQWATPYRGVLVTAAGADGWPTHAAAALLGVGAPSALSGLSAAYVVGLTTAPGHGVDVLVPHERRVLAPPGVTLTRSRHFTARVDSTGWPPRTRPADTVLDLAAATDLDGAISWTARALQKRLVSPAQLLAALQARGRHRHGPALVEFLGVDGLESTAEWRLCHDVLLAHGLPEGQRQAPASDGGGRQRRDVLIPEYGLAIEVDGRAAHEGWDKQRRDAGRDLDALGSGVSTARTGWVDVKIRPCELAVRLARALRARGWPGRPVRCLRRSCVVPSG